MLVSSFVTLHVGHGAELTLLAYLARVLLSLLVVGATALLAYWLLDVLAVRSASLTSGSRSEDDG